MCHPNRNHRNLNDRISLAVIKSGCQIIRQSDSIQLLGTRDGPRIVRALKRISKHLKVIFAENRRHQLENFRGSLVFLRHVSDKY